MRLIDHIGEDLTGERDLSKNTFYDDVWLLTYAAGSGREAARRLGVAESTFRGWRGGTVPRGGASRDEVRAAARQIAAGGRLADAMNGRTKLAIKAKVTVSSDERVRTLYIGRHLSRSAMASILQDWAEGYDLLAEGRLKREIDTSYAQGARIHIGRISSARFLEPGMTLM